MENRRLLSTAEILKKYRVSAATLWIWAKSSKIYVKKIGKRNYYVEEEIRKMTGVEEENAVDE